METTKLVSMSNFMWLSRYMICTLYDSINRVQESYGSAPKELLLSNKFIYNMEEKRDPKGQNKTSNVNQQVKMSSCLDMPYLSSWSQSLLLHKLGLNKIISLQKTEGGSFLKDERIRFFFFIFCIILLLNM